jgi:hypothetical protein
VVPHVPSRSFRLLISGALGTWKMTSLARRTKRIQLLVTLCLDDLG